MILKEVHSDPKNIALPGEEDVDLDAGIEEWVATNAGGFCKNVGKKELRDLTKAYDVLTIACIGIRNAPAALVSDATAAQESFAEAIRSAKNAANDAAVATTVVSMTAAHKAAWAAVAKAVTKRAAAEAAVVEAQKALAALVAQAAQEAQEALEAQAAQEAQEAQEAQAAPSSSGRAPRRRSTLTLDEMATMLNLNAETLNGAMKAGYEARLKRMIASNVVRTFQDVERLAEDDFEDEASSLREFSKGNKNVFKDHRAVLRKIREVRHAA